MDEKQRYSLTKNKLIAIETKSGEQKSAVLDQVKQLEQLETDFGVDQDIFTDVYASILSSNDLEISQKLLDNYGKLCAAIAQKDHITAIINVNESLKPGCYGFGKESEYDYTAFGSLVMSPATTGFERAPQPVLGLDRKPGKVSLYGNDLYKFVGSSEPIRKPRIVLASEGDDIYYKYFMDSTALPTIMLDHDSIIVSGLSGIDFVKSLTDAENRLNSKDPYLLQGVQRFILDTFIAKEEVPATN